MTLVRGHFQRTRSGYAYVRPTARRSSSGTRLLVIASVVASIVLILLVVAVVHFVVEHWIPIVVTMLVSGAVFGGVTLTGRHSRQRVTTYLELAREVVRGVAGHHEHLIRLSKRIPADDQQRVVGEEEIYRTLIAEILADGEITDEEYDRLKRIHEVFVFDSSRALDIRQEAFAGFVSWVGVDLTREQEVALRTVAARLAISEAHTSHWLGMVAGRRAEGERQAALAIERERQETLEAERAREAAIAAEQARQAEIAAEQERLAALAAERERQAAFAAERAREAAIVAEQGRQAEQQRLADLAAERLRAREVERERQAALVAERERQLREQRDAASAVFEIERRIPLDVEVKLKRGEACWWSMQVNLRDRKVMRSGACFVTNKRLLFVSDTTVSIPLSQMLDVAADPDSGLLRVVKDGRKTPYEFILDQPLVALAHVERSLQEVNETR